MRSWVTSRDVKANAKTESSKMMGRGSGTRRLRDSELRDEILDRMMVSAKFGFPAEFSALWADTLRRMLDPDDWNEPDMHAYFMECILGLGDEGFFFAMWACARPLSVSHRTPTTPLSLAGGR